MSCGWMIWLVDHQHRSFIERRTLQREDPRKSWIDAIYRQDLKEIGMSWQEAQ